MEKKQTSNKSRVIIENGEIKTILSEEVLRAGHMPIEEARRLSHEQINKMGEILGLL